MISLNLTHIIVNLLFKGTEHKIANSHILSSAPTFKSSLNGIVESRIILLHSINVEIGHS